MPKASSIETKTENVMCLQFSTVEMDDAVLVLSVNFEVKCRIVDSWEKHVCFDQTIAFLFVFTFKYTVSSLTPVPVFSEILRFALVKAGIRCNRSLLLLSRLTKVGCYYLKKKNTFASTKLLQFYLLIFQKYGFISHSCAILFEKID